MLKQGGNLGGSNDARGNLLAARYKIMHEKTTNMKISNIKYIVEMVLITKIDRKSKVVELLGVSQKIVHDCIYFTIYIRLCIKNIENNFI